MDSNPELAATPESEVQEKPLNFLGRLAGIFSSPIKTLADIAARPNYMAPLIIMLAGVLILTQISLPALLSDSEPAIEKSLEGRNLPPDQMDRAREIGMAYARNFSAVSAALYTLIASIVASAVLLFTGNIVMRGKANFRQIFSLYVWTGLVGVLGYIIRTPLALSKGTMKVFFGPAVLLPDEAEQTTLFRILAALDVFSLWRVALLALGFAAVYKFSKGKGFVALGSLYALLVVLSVALGGIFGR